jgi:hypothetical protein
VKTVLRRRDVMHPDASDETAAKDLAERADG